MVAPTATVNATIAKTVNETNVAETVAVEFRKVDEKTYDIYVVPVDETNTKAINRLSAAEMTFALEPADESLGMTFDIAGADNVNVNRDENDHVLFNFDGVNQADASGVEVKLGTVTFNGYGAFTFNVDEDEKAEVQTAKISDNIVSTYTVEGGTFVVGDDEIIGEVKVPKQNLTINVIGNNKFGNNAAAYQDMTVTISGGDLTTPLTYALGNDDANVSFNNDTYTLTVSDKLTQNVSYTVTVSGAGYRTARHTVNMATNKTLNFWNNVKTTGDVVETGVGTPSKTNFLAGDIVKDNNINIYDLSAVVSYFGTSNNVTAESAYAKYDLNRDGVIDSKDVAYVLVSWGK